jgi:hypothetical protein
MDDIVQRGYILLSSLLPVAQPAQTASMKVGALLARASIIPRHLQGLIISGEGYEASVQLTASSSLQNSFELSCMALPRFHIVQFLQAISTLLPCLVFLNYRSYRR